MCTVRTTDGEVSLVKREYLRNRKWYRIAFLQVTNDKKHDCWSSQAFASHRLEFYDIFHTKGPDETLKFAWNDEAETARKRAALMTENSRCVPATAGTGASGASIKGQAVAAVVTTLRDEDAKFWSCQQGTDNPTYFKSKENLNFWSERPHNHSS
jgi:hypothetical protein